MSKRDREFTWFNLGKSLVGSLLSGAIGAVGIGVSALVRTPRVAGEAFLALRRTKSFGPVLKTTLTPAVVVGAVAAPEIAVLGGLVYGLVEGFTEGFKTGFQAPSTTLQSVRKFHAEGVDEAVEGIIEWSKQEPEKVYEIRVVEALKGVLSGVVGLAITGSGVCFFTLINLPTIWGKCSRAIWESRAPLPFMVGAQVLVTALVGLAAPLTVILSALGGFGRGTYNGYTKGIGKGCTIAFSDVNEWRRVLHKALYEK